MSYQPGDVVAGYVVQAFAGRGGSSEVYRVHDPVADRTAALKVLDVEHTGSRFSRLRFQLEFEVAEALDHPNIIAVYDHGELPPTGAHTLPVLWTLLEYVEGSTGTALVPRDRAEPDLPRVLQVAGQLAAALDHAHGRDVVHRDVKPSNVLLEEHPAPRAVLTDFGIARFLDDARPLARNGRVLGSLPYAAPEVLQAQQLRPATDVYSLGCTLVELLTGSPPFPYSSPFAITHAHLSKPPPQLSRRRAWLPVELDALVARAMAKDPSERFASCAEFVDLVADALSGVQVGRPARGPRLRRWLSR